MPGGAMPAPHERAGLSRHAFLCLAPRCYALMLTSTAARRRDQKYDQRCRPLTDAMIVRAASAAADNHDCLLPIDTNSGGLAVLHNLIAKAAQGTIDFLLAAPGGNNAFDVYCI